MIMNRPWQNTKQRKNASSKQKTLFEKKWKEMKGEELFF
jgi:hypothetical protein